MSVPKIEQETTISYTREGGMAKIYTTDTTVITKLDKMCKASPAWELVCEEAAKKGGIVSKTYQCPKGLISYRKDQIKRELTEEQRKEKADRMKNARRQYLESRGQ